MGVHYTQQNTLGSAQVCACVCTCVCLCAHRLTDACSPVSHTVTNLAYNILFAKEVALTEITITVNNTFSR